jgi:hypothetical protein
MVKVERKYLDSFITRSVSKKSVFETYMLPTHVRIRSVSRRPKVDC